LESFGCFPREAALRLGDRHALAGPRPDQVCLDFGDHAQDVEEKTAYGIGRVVDGAADSQLDFPRAARRVDNEIISRYSLCARLTAWHHGGILHHGWHRTT
jgi:hypothetical protein